MPTYNLRTRDVMRRLNASRGSIRFWVSSGLLRCCQFSKRGHWRFSEEDLAEFISRSQRIALDNNTEHAA